MWFFLALVGYLLLAAVFVLDKFILTKSVSKPVVYTFYSTIFMFAALFAWPFGVELLVGIDWFWALVSGLGFGFGLWTMFIAVKQGEASHVNPFIGAVITVATFVFASAFLGESLTSLQVVGMLVLAGSTFLLAFFNETGFIGFNKSYAWGILAAVLFALSHTTAKYMYELYPFLTGFVWTRATTGIVGLITLAYPSVRATFRRRPTKENAIKSCTDCGMNKGHAIAIVISDKALGVVGVILIQLAIALGSVTLVNALIGAQYALMFLIIYLLTKLAPRIFKETFSRSEIAMQTVAIVLVIIGSALFVL